MCIDPKRILVLYRHLGPFKDVRAAIASHLQALEYCETRHEIIYYNAANGAPGWLRHFKFDVVIFHTTFLVMRWSYTFYIWKWGFNWLKDLRALKIAIPQDEYDHSEILDEWLYELGVSIIITNFDASTRRLLYPIMHNKATFYEALTGYINEDDVERIGDCLLPLADRPTDIIYRASPLPYWFGSHGQLKPSVGEIVQNRSTELGLICDISTRWEDAIVGSRWFDFLASGRVMIGPESGSSVLDRRGEIQAQIRGILQATPDLSFEEVSARMPNGWDNHQFFAVGPRHLEAVITKTAQVLIEGNYTGVLKANKHYIPLNRDFSNLDEVLAKIQDHQLLQAMVDRAYQDIYLSGQYTYQMFAKIIEQAIASAAKPNIVSHRISRGIGNGIKQKAKRILAQIIYKMSRQAL